MKRIILSMLMLALIMSMIPVMALSSSAVDVPGDWTTYRSSGSYDEPLPTEENGYTPAPGYEYTDEGFHMISADYTGATPYGVIQTKEKVSVKDGVYMELRVDQYPYGGEKGTADHWISFAIWDSPIVAPGNTKPEDGFGQGWLGMCRTPGGGKSGPVMCFMQMYSPTGSLGQGQANVAPKVDDSGKEIYTLEVGFDGTHYTISICGVTMPGSAVTEKLNGLNQDGEFYIGVAFHAGVANANIEATILKYGTSEETAQKPVGSDSKAPEENHLVTAPIADPSTVPQNKPCLLLDATESSCTNNFSTQDMSLTPQGDNSFKIEPYAPIGYFMWGIKRPLSFEAKDFPVIALMIHDPRGIAGSGSIRYSTGENMSADDVHIFSYSFYDDRICTYYGEKGDYIYVLLDMREMLTAEMYEEGWDGRINGLRMEFADIFLNNPIDPEKDFFIFNYAGIFRSKEEAIAYQEEYVANTNIVAPSETEAPTEAPVEVPTEAPTDQPADESNPAVTEGDAVTQDATGNAGGDKGCASVAGMSVSLIMMSIAAVIAVKKKNDF